MKDFFGTVGIILIMILVAIAIVGGIVLAMIPIQRKTCLERYKDLNPKYSFWSECQIRQNDKWIPADSYYIKEDK